MLEEKIKECKKVIDEAKETETRYRNKQLLANLQALKDIRDGKEPKPLNETWCSLDDEITEMEKFIENSVNEKPKVRRAAASLVEVVELLKEYKEKLNG